MTESAHKFENQPTPRGELSAEAILRVALNIADRDGLDGLTLRKIAGELGVSPMGVYRHFRNKAEIVNGLVDRVVGDYDVSGHDEEDWRDWMRETFRQMRQALLEHPGILPLLGTAAFAGSHALGVMNTVLGVMREAGLEADAPRLFHTMMSYTIGAIAIESSARNGPVLADTRGQNTAEEQERRMRLSFEMAPRREYPEIVEYAQALARFITEERFIEGLDHILKG